MAAQALDERGLYRLMSWLSPAFPVGSYSYSHALESAIADGLVHDRDTLFAWIATILAHGDGRVDAMLFVAIWRAVTAGEDAGLLEHAERAAAMRGSAELALESLQQGEAFLATVLATWPNRDLRRLTDGMRAAGIAPAYVSAVALTAAVAAVPLSAALTACLHAFAANLVSAGLRLIPLGQTDGQRITAWLEPVVADAVRDALTRPFEDLGTATPAVDLHSMRHETLHMRLFRS